MADTIRIICCLGNPGERYHSTRHNLGFWLGDRLVERARGRWTHANPEFDAARVRIAGHDVVVVKPMTYMNLSGEALECLAEREAFTPGQVLVVCDDFALPAGTLRLRQRGSDGGHNGLKSVISSLGTQSFPRLRLGVGPAPEGVDPADFVTEPMEEGAVDEYAGVLRQAQKCVETALRDGIPRAMSRFNKRAEPRGTDRPDGEGETR